MMKVIAFAIILATTSSLAVAQVPQTVPLTGKDGQKIGTATFSGNRIFLRNLQNEIFAQIVFERDGTRTMYDVHGKVLDRIPGDAAPK
jgi:hypothetical protein